MHTFEQFEQKLASAIEDYKKNWLFQHQPIKPVGDNCRCPLGVLLWMLKGDRTRMPSPGSVALSLPQLISSDDANAFAMGFDGETQRLGATHQNRKFYNLGKSYRTASFC